MGQIKPGSVPKADGKLGVMCVGLGAVASTFIAGVELTRKGLAKPYGSLTQLATIRLGKRTDNTTPLIREFVRQADGSYAVKNDFVLAPLAG